MNSKFSERWLAAPQPGRTTLNQVCVTKEGSQEKG